MLIQTRYPDHPLLLTLARDGYRAFAAQALHEREAAAMPPFSHQVLLRADASDPHNAHDFVAAAADLLRRQAATGIAVWGPVPAPMARRAGRHRVHLLIQAARREALHRLLDGAIEQIAGLREAGRVRWSLDVDPLDLY